MNAGDWKEGSETRRQPTKRYVSKEHTTEMASTSRGCPSESNRAEAKNFPMLCHLWQLAVNCQKT